MAGSIYHAHWILILCLKDILHIRKETFDFVERTEIDLRTVTVLGVADIKSLYTNISLDLRLKAFEYWTVKVQYNIEHLQRFTNNFAPKGISTILKLV